MSELQSRTGFDQRERELVRSALRRYMRGAPHRHAGAAMTGLNRGRQAAPPGNPALNAATLHYRTRTTRRNTTSRFAMRSSGSSRTTAKAATLAVGTALFGFLQGSRRRRARGMAERCSGVCRQMNSQGPIQGNFKDFHFRRRQDRTGVRALAACRRSPACSPGTSSGSTHCREVAAYEGVMVLAAAIRPLTRSLTRCPKHQPRAGSRCTGRLEEARLDASGSTSAAFCGCSPCRARTLRRQQLVSRRCTDSDKLSDQRPIPANRATNLRAGCMLLAADATASGASAGAQGRRGHQLHDPERASLHCTLPSAQ